MKMLHKVWKKLIWVWNKCQGYEKSAWWYETNDKCSETNTPLKDARPPRNRLGWPWCFSTSISVPNPSMHSMHWKTTRRVMMWGFSQSGIPHCTTNGFFQDGICVVWDCFVPFRTVFVWCGFVLYHLYCFQVYSYTTGTTQYLFHNQKRVENCIVCQ